MSDYGTLRNRVLDELDRTGDMTAQASNAILDAIKHYEHEPFWFNEERATSSTVAGQEYYALPTDFVMPVSLVVTVNNYTTPLNLQHYTTLEEWFISSGQYTGDPSDYAIYDQQFRLYPIPNDAYTLTLSYIKRLAELSSDTSSNAWTTTCEELIRSRAAGQLCLRILQEPDRAAAFIALEQQAWARLNSERVRRAMTGHAKKRVW